MILRPLAPLLLSTVIPLAAATMEEGLAFKRAQRLPEAAKAFAELVAANPADVDALEQLATVTAWMGNHAEALPLWDRAIALAPQYHGLQVSRARLLYWMGYLDQAQAALDRYVIAADGPCRRDFDAWILVGDVYRARHLNAKAYGAYQQALAIDPEWQQVQARLQHVAPPFRWRVDAGAMFDDYDPANATVVQRDREQTAYLQAGYRLTEALTLAGGTDYAHQFGQVDWRWNIEAYWSPDEEWAFHGRVATTPDADVLSRWEALLGADWQRLPGLTPLLSIRTADYADERIVTYMPGIRVGEAITAEARLYYTTSDTNDATMAGMLRLGTSIAERWHPYVLGSFGEENQPPVGVARTATGAAGVVVDLSGAVSLRLDGLYEWREDIHTRVSLGGGVTLRF
jgi:YaiO family outer membrane protein